VKLRLGDVDGARDKEGQAMLAESRVFKRELVGIDAREAASAIREIDADLKRCSDAMARLGPA
jgi:hypothetical protein